MATLAKPGLILAIVVALLATSCAADSTNATGERSIETEPTAVEPEADPAESGAASGDPADVTADEPAEEDLTGAGSEPEPTATPIPDVEADLEARRAGFDGLTLGDCWDNLGTPGNAIPSDPVDCDGRHMHETYAMTEIDGDQGTLYPGTQVLSDRVFDEVCAPELVDFAGRAWTELPLRTWVWYPLADDWNRGARTAVCTVGTSSADVEAPFKVGTARAGSLVTDDAVVARGVVAGESSLFLSYQSGSLYQLTSELDVGLAGMQVLDTGVLFSARLRNQDATVPGRPWFLDYEDPRALSAIDVEVLSSSVIDSQLVVGGSSTVFASRASDTDDWNIFISSDDGVVQLTENPGDDRWPRVLPDETGIVYNADGRLWVMDLDGDNQRAITDDAGGDLEPAVSPDGSQVAFTSRRMGNEDIWLVNLDGTGLRNLTEHPSTDAWPFWSRDGERILWQTDRLGVSSHIMVMTAAGENPSYFSVEQLGHGATIPNDAAAELEVDAVRLDGRSALPGEGSFNQIEGEPGGLGLYEHSSGRVSVSLPVGWEVVEMDLGRAAQFIAAERVDAFGQTWMVDGAMISLIEDNDAVWQSAIASADANGCVEDARSETGGEAPSGDALEITTIEFTCGEAAAWIVAVRNTTTETGLLLEAQFDLSPSRAADEAWVIEISQTMVWG